MAQIAKIKNAQADKAVFGVLGEDWVRQQAANISRDLANNEGGAGGAAAAGAGLGMGIGAGGVFGGMAQQIFAPMNPAPAPAPPQQDPVAKIKQLKEMFDLGAISQAEFDAKKQEILSRI
jgi:membrane protease subunit (stomatin/prohibitin family)